MERRSALRRLADQQTGDLADYVRQLRAEGNGWRDVSRRLEAETGIAISYETLRSWFKAEAAA